MYVSSELRKDIRNHSACSTYFISLIKLFHLISNFGFNLSGEFETRTDESEGGRNSFEVQTRKLYQTFKFKSLFASLKTTLEGF
jgi:hypothetical protein